MKILVYCTGGTSLGYGHFFRSITFAKQAPENVDLRLLPLIEEEDKHLFSQVKNITHYCHKEEDVIKIAEDYKPDVFIFDTVACSKFLVKEVKARVQLTASISPIFNCMDSVDVLFTRNIHAENPWGISMYKGMEYAIFNEKCFFIPDETYYNNLSKEHLTIGISMGGGDAPNKTLDVLKEIAKIKIPCTFWVLLGEGYKHSYQQLVDSIDRDSFHEIILAKSNRSMWNIMSNCSVLILAGGLTTIEAVYAGIPSLNIFEKEQHLEAMGTHLFDEGVAENIGAINDSSLENLKNRIDFFINNKSHLLKMRENSKGKVDKLAPTRIYEIIRLSLPTPP